jgi:hypothetical protein
VAVPMAGGSRYHSFEPSASRWEPEKEKEKEKDDEPGRGRTRVRGGEEEKNKDEEGWSWRTPPVMNMVHPLLLPNSPRALHFTGKNVTAFVQLIEDLFKDCQIPYPERRAKVV